MGGWGRWPPNVGPRAEEDTPGRPGRLKVFSEPFLRCVLEPIPKPPAWTGKSIPGFLCDIWHFFCEYCAFFEKFPRIRRMFMRYRYSGSLMALLKQKLHFLLFWVPRAQKNFGICWFQHSKNALFLAQKSFLPKKLKKIFKKRKAFPSQE